MAMGFQYWFTVCAAFLVGPISLAQSFIYCRRGVYTKTFKGTSRKEYIHKDDKPIEFWFSIIFHLVMGIVMIVLGFWLLEEIPAVNHWFSEIRAMLPFRF
ncbi:DUF2542 family protein [Scandinavium sp.]|uniref:DUF2542 family protein n=1 Tax=Scandinavium sp. TaxID=2830653 RepID=UPI0028A01FDB|nr:DUF2542 family protein [Scandinavium sp.]